MKKEPEALYLFSEEYVEAREPVGFARGRNRVKISNLFENFRDDARSIISSEARNKSPTSSTIYGYVTVAVFCANSLYML